MARSLASASLVLVAFALAGCHGGTVTTGDAGPVAGPPDSGFVVPVDAQDGGVFKTPDIATSFGPFTGEFDVNGAGQLLAIQVDGHLALQVNDPSQVYLGKIDGGAFSTEIVYPELETCGALTIDGTYKEDAGYHATEELCTAGTFASGPLVGQRFGFPDIYKQNLAWSGVYDTTEKPAASNTCSFVPASTRLSVGVARDRDGGATTVALFDTLASQLVYGGVDDTSGVLRARAQDSQGDATDSFSLYFIADGGVMGTREVQVFDENDAGCVAELQLSGAKR